MQRFKRVFIGDRSFYKTVVAIVIPVIIQNSVSNFVNLLDNIMVGQLGTAQMSGVSIANQLIFVYILCVFGSLSGPSIFGAQFFGAGDTEGFRNTFRIKIWLTGMIYIIALILLIPFGGDMIRLFLTGDGDPALAEEMLSYGRQYLNYSLLGLLPFALTMSYASTMRETGETMLPMKASIAAVLVNLGGNWVLIFGHLGFPPLGVRGAAIATVFSRFVELSIILYASKKHTKFAYFRRVYHQMRVPFYLFTSVMRKGSPLLLNEALWSVGMTTLTQTYSMRALYVLAGLNIASTISNLFNVVFLSMGNAVAVLVGQALGANNMKKAREDSWKLVFLSASMCVIFSAVMASLSGIFPHFFNTDEEVRRLASYFILISSILMPVFAITHSSYFILRSGGSTFVTFLFDSVFTWAVMVPFAVVLVRFTSLDITLLYAISQSANLVKCVIGILLVRNGMWLKNIVSFSNE